MAGFDDNVAVMGEWMPHSPSPRTLFTAVLGEEKSSKPVLERELSLNHGQIGLVDVGKKDSSQTGSQLAEEKPSSRGGLGERIAARAGFNAPRLNTENIRSAEFSFNPDVRSPCLTISSPGLSPATLLESPVFLSNPLVQPSPTTGKFSFHPGGNNNTLSSGPPDKTKDDFFEDIGASFTFQPISKSSSSFIPGAASKGAAILQNSFPNMEVLVEYDNSHRSQTVEGLKPGSQNTESVNLQSGFPGTSTERHYKGSETNLGDQRTFDATNVGTELDDPQDEEQRRNGGDLMAGGGGGAPAEDGYNWRKYGQKQVKGSEYPRSYYKCTHPNCLVKKKVERSREGHITEIIYKGAHNHPKPPPNRRSAIGSSNLGLDMQINGTEQTEQQSGMGRDSAWASTQQPGTTDNVEVTSPASVGFEYGNQSGSLQVQGGTQFESGDTATVVDASSTFSNDEDEDDRGTHGSVSLGYDGEGDESESKRRKLEVYASEMSGATRAIREPRVVVQTTSDVDILDDGYRWRKYGQKVVKGNPNPRSYYKCTAPGCTVRKHVERASHDLKSVITTYEGKHNHDVPVARNSNHGGTGGGSSGSATLQAASAAQTHVRQTEPRNRFERPVSTNPSFGCPFNFQPQLGPPPGFSFGMSQQGLAGLTIPGLAFGQGKLPVLPVHPYLAPQPPVSSSGLMLPRAEPKVEPMSETGLGLSSSSSIYRQIMSRLPQI